MGNHTRKNVDSVEQENVEAANEAPAEDTAAATGVQPEQPARTHKRCHDHPTNFSGEDALRPITEFYGTGTMVYCRRCQSIRGKQRREALKTNTAPTGLRAQLNEVRQQLEAAEAEVVSLRARLAQYEPDTNVPEFNEPATDE